MILSHTPWAQQALRLPAWSFSDVDPGNNVCNTQVLFSHNNYTDGRERLSQECTQRKETTDSHLLNPAEMGEERVICLLRMLIAIFKLLGLFSFSF